MNKQKKLRFLFIIISLFLLLNSLQSQTQEETKFFLYKDTGLVYSNVRFNITKCMSTSKKLQCELIINNSNNSYVVLDPFQIYSTTNNGKNKSYCNNHSSLVVPPMSSQKFELTFKGLDFRNPNVGVVFTKIQFTDSLFAVYNFQGLLLTEKNQRRVGSITYTLINRDFDKSKNCIRLSGKLNYRGDKFLVISLENAILKTNDGNAYYNIGEKGWYIKSYNNTYYDKNRKYEKQFLFFPTKKKYLKFDMQSTLNFENVLKEYSIKSIDGFNLQLVH